MNAAAKTLSQGNLFRGDFSIFTRGSTNFVATILWLAVIVSALCVVYVRNLERQYVHELDQTTHQTHLLTTEHSQLLLEKSMWSAPGRVRHIAHQQLEMIVSKPSYTVSLTH
jgi:cell division protein FtsL